MITLEIALSVLKGEYFHSVNISGFIDFGWTVEVIDHAGRKYVAYHKELHYAIFEVCHMAVEGRMAQEITDIKTAKVLHEAIIKNADSLLNPDGDKTEK